MKKLTVLLVVIMLVAGLLTGCGIIPGSRLWKIEVGAIEGEGFSVYFPPDIEFEEKGGTAQLEVIAFYDDGTIADVTLECDYTASKPEALTQAVAIVSTEGLITAIKEAGGGKGYATILISYTQRNFWISNITRTAEVKVTANY